MLFMFSTGKENPTFTSDKCKCITTFHIIKDTLDLGNCETMLFTIKRMPASGKHHNLRLTKTTWLKL